jgi:hypothetical protein
MRVRPQRYICPHCKWDFAYRKKRCCPGCRTILLIASDMLFDSDLSSLKSFWIWEPLKEKWKYVRDWEVHKREAMLKFDEYVNGKAYGIDGGDKPQPLKDWIQ